MTTSPPRAMDIDMLGPVELDLGLLAEQKQALVVRVQEAKPRYLGTYAPGDYHLPTYRLVIPQYASSRPGRGFHGAREEVIVETADRRIVDELLSTVQLLAETPSGPVAVRHICNAANAERDEGLRLVWANRDGLVDDGADEMADWPRRDKLIQEGQPVCADPESMCWLPNGMTACGLDVDHHGHWGAHAGVVYLPPLMTGHLGFDESGYSTPIMTPLSAPHAIAISSRFDAPGHMFMDTDGCLEATD